jgi:hypothetical protein
MGSPTRYAYYGKEMLGWIREKMATQASALGGGKFSASNSTVVGNGASACNDLCVPNEDCSIAVGNGSLDNAHTSDPSSRGERPGRKPSVLMQHAQHTGGSSDG